MARIRLMVGLLAAALPALSLAQGKALEDKKAVSIQEIERGFFFGVSGGYWGTINPPAGAGSSQPFSHGQGVQIEMGFDFGERISPALVFMATTNRAGSDYTGLSGGQASGDFGAIIPGATVKVRLLGLNDAQDVMRSWFYVRGTAGFMLYSPSKLLPGPDVLVSAGPGFEYFTRLRHFSIAVEATFNFMALTQSMGFSVFPSVRYAF